MPDGHPPLKRSWPNFIMGGSEAWLIPVSEYTGEWTKNSQTGSIQDLVAAKENNHNAVEKTWQEEGGLTLLDDLNALFGYVPVAARADANLVRFRIDRVPSGIPLVDSFAIMVRGYRRLPAF
jgi:hypothetical protein